MSTNNRCINWSVYDWCVSNSREDILNRWDYSLNKKTPQETFCRTKEVWLKCPLGIHDSEKRSFTTITRRKYPVLNCSKCNSFAQHGITKYGEDFLKKFWDFEKNVVNPWNISKSSNVKIWIKCQTVEYHGSYCVSPKVFTSGNGCPYCNGKRVHPKDSFGQYHIDNTDKDFIEKYWGTKNTKSAFEYMPRSRKYVWLKCTKNPEHGEYRQKCAQFTHGHRCGYCKKTYLLTPKDSVGAKHPDSLLVWGTNEKSPFDYAPQSNKKVMWKCENNEHEEYSRSIQGSLIANFKCPSCAAKNNSSALQDKVMLYFEQLGYHLRHENHCSVVPINPKTKHIMPFDNEVIELSLIVETSGKQHFQIQGFHIHTAKKRGTTPEQELHKRKLYDRYKKLFALSKGYFYLEIPYWTEKDESYKNLIDDKISEILKIKNKQKVS